MGTNYIDLSPDKGVIELVLFSGVQQSATGTSVAKAIAPCKGRVVAVAAWVDVIGGTTKCTDYDIIIEKGSDDLHTAIAAVGASTNAGPQMGALVSTATVLAVAAGDILHLDATLAGGASPTLDGIQGRVWIARE